MLHFNAQSASKTQDSWHPQISVRQRLESEPSSEETKGGCIGAIAQGCVSTLVQRESRFATLSESHLLSLGRDNPCTSLAGISTRGRAGHPLSTSSTLCCRICCSVLGFSSSFCTLAMMLWASSRCWRCLTWLSYRTHESSTLLASAASAVRCSSSYAWASSLAVS